MGRPWAAVVGTVGPAVVAGRPRRPEGFCPLDAKPYAVLARAPKADLSKTAPNPGPPGRLYRSRRADRSGKAEKEDGSCRLRGLRPGFRLVRGAREHDRGQVRQAEVRPGREHPVHQEHAGGEV